MMKKYDNLLNEVRTIIDDVASSDDTEVFDFEGSNNFSYETLRDLVSVEITEHVLKTLNNPDMSPEDNLALLISSMSYMSMQNFVLEYKILTNK
jgi:hypothetical protein